ncbi:hypothetical protein OG887_31190 [Streptomyces sp. NBC_00053]|uniref:hypothetical protein n=1 Tax=unclassified Streptomyces TaxID=2593676 RepID=UPI000F5C0623|nr:MULTISPECIES: hypothetical protein [unclassified Streptomyces]WSG53951.1 hypothetical protein OHA38_31465 [Streptomyces sp. NBC_01732]WSX04583.1 hypothetical protein OG355_31445 [Streptomyces sp. NBC_00987]MCX4393149.1 hypothetical protein [Streptomyces sp. NBC_01767]MCX5105264.1 hypothetical protein [Streptomyces sp. NBC_00439]MCX5163580.1 hypothetical protein [Streptomyces sp. NBC_00305]
MMRKDELDTQTWSDALKMYEWLCTFVGVARRAHEEWWFDVGSIMRLETRDPRDPRGWESIDRYRGEVKRLDNPLYLWWDTPSTPADVERYSGRVGELPRESVRSLLVLLGVTASGVDVFRTFGWEKYRPQRERRAEVVLSRFPVDIRFYTNFGWKGDLPDF